MELDKPLGVVDYGDVPRPSSLAEEVVELVEHNIQPQGGVVPRCMIGLVDTTSNRTYIHHLHIIPKQQTTP